MKSRGSMVNGLFPYARHRLPLNITFTGIGNLVREGMPGYILTPSDLLVAVALNTVLI
jgi:hypothetical protein